MSKAVTLIRKRDKEGKPGPWEIAVGPDAPIADHIAAWSDLSYNVTHEEVAEVLCCKLYDLQRHLTFPTKAEAKTEADQQKKFAEKQKKSQEEAAARQKKIDAENAKADADAHAAKVADMNKLHDKVRGTPAR